MTPDAFSEVCDTIRGSYRDGLTEDQVRGWWRRLQRLDGTLVRRIVDQLCERPIARPPVIGEVMDAYYREMAGRQESEIPTDPEGRLKEIRDRYWRTRTSTPGPAEERRDGNTDRISNHPTRGRGK